MNRFISKFIGGEYVKFGKTDKNVWKVCRKGHIYDNHNHKYYKCYRGNVIDYQRGNRMITV